MWNHIYTCVFVYFVSGILFCVWVLFAFCMGWGISGSVLRPRLGPPCSSALVALQMITCAHNIAAQAEPQLVINVSCAQASKQTFSSKADVKLCATNSLILVHDDVISMRMILEAENLSATCHRRSGRSCGTNSVLVQRTHVNNDAKMQSLHSRYSAELFGNLSCCSHRCRLVICTPRLAQAEGVHNNA